MAQAGNYTPIQLYYSTAATATPLAANLNNGELAINIADGKLFYKDSVGVVQLLASQATSSSTISFGSTGLTPSSATSGSVVVDGTLNVANGGTGVTTSTGTGSVVLSTNPLFVTTVNLGKLSSVNYWDAAYSRFEIGPGTLAAPQAGGVLWLANNLQAAASSTWRIGGQATYGSTLGQVSGNLYWYASTTNAAGGLTSVNQILFANRTGQIQFNTSGVPGSLTHYGTASISSTVTLPGLTASTALALDASKNIVSVTNTGTGSNVLATSPTLVTPALGTPASGNFSTGTFTWPTFNQSTTGTAAGLSTTLAVASGGTGATTAALARTSLGAQETLTSTVNIKSINGSSLLGSGDLVVSGGGGTPGGATTQVQYNSAGSFAGSANFVFDGTNVGIGEATPATYGKLVVGSTTSATAALVSTSSTLTDKQTLEFRKTVNTVSGNNNSLGRISFNGKFNSTAGEQAYLSVVSTNLSNVVDSNEVRLATRSLSTGADIGYISLSSGSGGITLFAGDTYGSITMTSAGFRSKADSHSFRSLDGLTQYGRVTSAGYTFPDGTVQATAAGSATGGARGQTFTVAGSGQTFTIPTGVVSLKVTVVGAGGSGSGEDACCTVASGLAGGTSSVSSGTQTIGTVSATGGGGGDPLIFGGYAVAGVGAGGVLNGRGAVATYPFSTGGSSLLTSTAQAAAGTLGAGGSSGGGYPGAAGGSAIAFLTGLTPGNTLAVTIGAGGAQVGTGFFGYAGGTGVVIFEW